jgi:DNA-binding NarL/FixJ family response regulator
MPAHSNIRILVADDHEMVRSGVKVLLAGTEIDVVAEATTSQAALTLALKEDVDLVLLDVRMPDGDGLSVLSRLKFDRPDLPVLLFSAFDNRASVAKAIALGARGFLLKGCSRDEFVNAIRVAAAGEHAWSKEILRDASRSHGSLGLACSFEVSLSDSESEVLRKIAIGLTDKQIATAMKINYNAARVFVQHVFRKLGVTDRTQAAVWAVWNGFV